ncbi:MAG: zinc ribbon domain-containing protein [Chloroflexota bacterium]
MSDKFEFVRNYNDLSTDQGFQFEFFCDRCGRGYRTRFQTMATGAVSGVLEAAGSIFGGFFSTASDIGERVHSAAWERAHDGAFAKAAKEVQGDFVQCPRCQSWVCRKACWNAERGLCKECAPDLGVEMAAAQANRSVEEVWAHAKMAEEDKKLAKGNWRAKIRASCPECGAALATNAKFCPECGAKLQNGRHCRECGAKLTSGAKFCPECGAKAK